MTFSDMDYWRLSDVLSVTSAAMLAADIDPGVHEAVHPHRPDDGYFHTRGTSNNSANYFQSSKFIAVFQALRRAILSEKLSATLAKRSRAAEYVWHEGEPWPASPEEAEAQIGYDSLLRLGGGTFKTNVDAEDFGRFRTIYFLKEPDWNETTVLVDDLKAWMKQRNFKPPFFFPSAKADGFRNPEHDRYSPKLACAVAAWEAVTKPRQNKSVKATISDWVTTHGVNFGLTDNQGVLPASAVEEISKVVNWDTRGGGCANWGMG